jgi:hypothetical protein
MSYNVFYPVFNCLVTTSPFFLHPDYSLLGVERPTVFLLLPCVPLLSLSLLLFRPFGSQVALACPS